MQLRLLVFFVVFFFMSSISLASNFPHRKDYPDVKIIELEELKTGYDKGTFMVVDVRSTLEYDVLKVKGAFHIDMSKAGFVEKLKALAAKNPGKKIVLYCNGGDSIKSYKSARDALVLGMENIFAFDAGIVVWANAYPSQTMLLGSKITDAEKQLIPESELKKVSLDIDTFKQKAAEANSIVIDARKTMQRTQKLPGFKKALLIPVDKFIPNVIRKGNMKNKQLLIFDQAGQQVPWLMYYLVDKEYTKFYFLEGGAMAAF